MMQKRLLLAALLSLVVALLAACGGDDESDEGELTRAAPVESDIPNDDQVVPFQLADGNISCTITRQKNQQATARCDIGERDWEPPKKPASCKLDYGNGVFVSTNKSGYTCAGDTLLGSDAPVLEEGTYVVAAGIRCTAVEAARIHCASTASSHSFLMAADSAQVL